MLSKNESEERARSIRRQLLNYMTLGTPHARICALIKAQEELAILVRMETEQEEENT